MRAVAPDGASSDVRVDDGVAFFSATQKVGLYRFEAGGQFHSIAVNLLTGRNLTARRALPETAPNAQLAIDEDAVAWPMWPWLALAALLALLSEWSAARVAKGIRVVSLEFHEPMWLWAPSPALPGLCGCGPAPKPA